MAHCKQPSGSMGTRAPLNQHVEPLCKQKQLSSLFGVNSPAAEAGIPPRRGSVDMVLTEGEVHRILPISVTAFSEI